MTTRAASSPVAIPDLGATGYKLGHEHVPAPLADANYFRLDPAMGVRLRMYLEADERDWCLAVLDEFGGLCGGRIAALSFEANRHTPELNQLDARGARVDEIAFHPSYLEMCRLAYGFGLAQMNHLPEFRGLPRTPSRLVKAMAGILFSAAEQGLYCPIFMTDCLIGVLEAHGGDEVKARYLPRFRGLDPDGYFQGAQLMTEKYGGSDVGATETRALREGGAWRLYGDKWFCSNANADLFSTLARHDDSVAGTKGLAMFVVPRRLEDGSLNRIRVNRVKDKLGTRSMASAEFTFDGALAYLVGPLEQGFKIMCDMLNGSRLATATMATGAMRRAVMEAVHFAGQRRTFGEVLHAHGMVKRALADAHAETEGAAALLAWAYALYDRLDRAPASAEIEARLRLATALAKMNNSARCVEVASECLQVLGGVGYIEDRATARIYRDAQVHAIWEGTTNMLVLDVLRAIAKLDADVALGRLFEEMEDGLARNETRFLFAPLRQDLEATLAVLRASLGAEKLEREYFAHGRAEALAAAVIGLVLLHEAEFRLAEDRDSGGLDLAKAYLWKRKPALMAGLYGEGDRLATAAAVSERLFA